MISKGLGDIKSLQSISTEPGPMTEKGLLLKLYKLASQKANFLRKKEWAERQRFQAVRHLLDVQRRIESLKNPAMVQMSSFPALEKEKVDKREKKPKWNEVPLKY